MTIILLLMKYKTKGINDIPTNVCPLCDCNVDKSITGLTGHIRSCDERKNKYISLPYEEIFITNDYSLRDFINDNRNLDKIIIELSNSDDLDEIKNKNIKEVKDYLLNNYFNKYQIKDTNTTLFNIIVWFFELDNEVIDEFSK